MLDFQKLEPVALKAFYYAAETLSFTRATDKAALNRKI
jgi:hypothetical protein